MAGRIGDLIFQLMGQQDPQQVLTAALGTQRAGGGTQAPAGVGPATTIAGGGQDQPAVPAQPAQPAQPDAYTTPPDIGALYERLLDRQSRNDGIDRGLTMIAGGLTRNDQHRREIMAGMPQQQAQQDPLISAGRLMALQQGQQELARKAAARANLPLIAKRYNLDLNTATYLYDTGQLDNIIQDAEKAKLTGDETKFYGTPIYGKDDKGNLIVGQLASNGTIKWQNGDGTQVVGGVKVFDTGTAQNMVDAKTGAPIGSVPIDNKGKALATAQGAAQSDAGTKLPGIETSTDEAIKNIDVLTDPKNDEMLDTLTGWSGLITRFQPGQTKDFQARIEQLTGQSFLQAMESLRGTGQITEVEGTKATQAIARLQQSQSKEGFKAALLDLKNVLEEIRQNMRVRAGQSAPAQTATPAPAAQGNIDAVLKKYGIQ